nr:MAG TPA: hypothetical protein [Caudoviricetes sp.]
MFLLNASIILKEIDMKYDNYFKRCLSIVK